MSWLWVRERGRSFLSGLLFAAAACSGGGPPAGPELEIEGAWVRAMPIPEASAEGAPMNTAAYLVLRNEGGTPDRLLGGVTAVASALELHESREEEGIMRMRPVEGIDLPPRGRVELRPGGLHLMLLGIDRPLAEGDTVELELRFQRSGTLSVRAPVRFAGPGQE